MKKLLILSLLLLPLLSSCAGSEPNNTAYVTALGIDKGEGSNFNFTIQFAKPSAISGGSSEEGGKDGSKTVENIFIEAPSIYSALNIANSVISKEFSLAHMRIAVFSADIAKEGMGDIMQTFAKSNDIRPDLLLAVSRSKAGEYLENIKPMVELNPIKYYQLIYEKNNFGTIPNIDALDVYFALDSGQRDPVLPLAGVMKAGTNSDKGGGEKDSGSENNGEESEPAAKMSNIMNEPTANLSSSQNNENNQNNAQAKLNQENKLNTNPNGFQYRIKNYQAGDAAVTETDKSEALGMAVFSDGKLSGMLGETQAELYNILNGSYSGGFVTFTAEQGSSSPVTVHLKQFRRPSYKIDSDARVAKIKLNLECDIYSFGENDTVDSQTAKFEEHCSRVIERECENFLYMLRDEYGADVLGLGEKAKKCFSTIDAYNAYDWHSEFINYRIEVEAKLKTRHSGLTVRENG